MPFTYSVVRTASSAPDSIELRPSPLFYDRTASTPGHSSTSQTLCSLFPLPTIAASTSSPDPSPGPDLKASSPPAPSPFSSPPLASPYPAQSDGPPPQSAPEHPRSVTPVSAAMPCRERSCYRGPAWTGCWLLRGWKGGWGWRAGLVKRRRIGQKW